MTLKDYTDSAPVVLIEFYASWCPHCQRMMPVVAEVKELLDGRANVYQFDVDRDSDLANEANVESIPAFIVYRDGRVYRTATGEMDGSSLLSMVEAAI